MPYNYLFFTILLLIRIFFFAKVLALVHGPKCALGYSSPKSPKKSVTQSRINLFDTALLQRVAQNSHSNVVLSPLSLKIALGMIFEGAEGETAREISRALKLPKNEKLARIEIKKWMNSLKLSSKGGHPQYMSAANRSIINVANQIFLDQEYTIQPNYHSTLKNTYKADVTSVDKKNPGLTASKINNWVKKETSGMIQYIVTKKDITDDFSIGLGNAIYFKGIWRYHFVKEYTQTMCFYNIKGQCTRTKMMGVGPVALKYASIPELDAAVAELPYADGAYSMLIVLPNKRDGIQKLIKNIHHFSIDAIAARLAYPANQNVSVVMPKFTVISNSDMVKTFKSLNISKIFGPGAELNNMVKRQSDGANRIYMEKILHSCKIIVNEEGSEAAASTLGVGSAALALPVPKILMFVADHPFLYFIRDTTSNAALFAGQYYEPQY